MELGTLKEVYIFGAHSRARTLKGYLDCLAPHCKVLGFLVNDDAENPESIDRIPVTSTAEMPKDSFNAPVFIAIKGMHHGNVEIHLREIGFMNIVPLSPELHNSLRSQYVQKIFQNTGRGFPHVSGLCTANITPAHETPIVYMTKTIYDLPLASQPPIPEYMRIVQGGAVLTDIHIAELRDDTGDNISLKNRQYNENTVLYWLWKNTCDHWFGLCHYRRWFDLSPDQIAALPNTGIDALLPVPTLELPSICANYSNRHGADNWDFMMGFLKKHLPDYHETAANLFNGAEYFGNLFFPCNMFIAKREIIDKYCEWLFPILDAVAENGGEKRDAYMNRYIGTISERLLTLYFMHNREKHRIALADRLFFS